MWRRANFGVISKNVMLILVNFSRIIFKKKLLNFGVILEKKVKKSVKTPSPAQTQPRFVLSDPKLVWRYVGFYGAWILGFWLISQAKLRPGPQFWKRNQPKSYNPSPTESNIPPHELPRTFGTGWQYRSCQELLAIYKHVFSEWYVYSINIDNT